MLYYNQNDFGKLFSFPLCSLQQVENTHYPPRKWVWGKVRKLQEEIGFFREEWRNWKKSNSSSFFQKEVEKWKEVEETERNACGQMNMQTKCWKEVPRYCEVILEHQCK